MFEDHDDYQDKDRHIFIQRSISAPPVAEHVSESSLAMYNMYDTETPIDSKDIFYKNIPSRLNPRLPKHVKVHDTADININDYFDDAAMGILDDPTLEKDFLSSLHIDTKPKTPMSLIQEDFPATPSAIYSKLGIVTDDALLEGDEVPSPLNSTRSILSAASPRAPADVVAASTNEDDIPTTFSMAQLRMIDDEPAPVTSTTASSAQSYNPSFPTNTPSFSSNAPVFEPAYRYQHHQHPPHPNMHMMPPPHMPYGRGYPPANDYYMQGAHGHPPPHGYMDNNGYPIPGLPNGQHYHDDQHHEMPPYYPPNYYPEYGRPPYPMPNHNMPSPRGYYGMKPQPPIPNHPAMMNNSMTMAPPSPAGQNNNSAQGGKKFKNSPRDDFKRNAKDNLVEEFRLTYGKTKQWELADITGHVIVFCQDQHGSRFIQQKLEVANDFDKQNVFDEIIPALHTLMIDVFGNYVIQKLFEYGTPAQCECLGEMLSGHTVNLALQMYGCRVIQKALEYVNVQRLILLVSEFEGDNVLRCVHDQNGNHVIQKCIEVISRVAKEAPAELADYLSSRIQFIIQAFHGRVKELSMHPYGCRVVQRILEYCTNAQKASLLEELRVCCNELVQDQYGNYVIQHVMQHGWDADRSILIKEVTSKLLEYSQHKFASNVVEKCLQYSNKKDRDEMIWGIINITFDINQPVDIYTGSCVLENMVRDPYANYVVQKVIDVSDEKQRGAIIRYVRENIVQLRKYTYGKHIIVRLEKVSGEKF